MSILLYSKQELSRGSLDVTNLDLNLDFGCILDTDLSLEIYRSQKIYSSIQ